MSKIQILDLLQQDIKDINGLVNYDKYGLTKAEMRKQARGIIINLQEHLEEFVQITEK